MDKWEYKTMKFETKGFFGGKVNLTELEEGLNALGQDGWELTSTFETNLPQGGSREVICVFKRKKAL